MADERVLVTADPLNAETRLDLQEGPLTGAHRHYVRSHFSFPDPPTGLSVGGAVRRGRSLTIEELRSLPTRTTAVTLECAGNGRAFLQPPAPGEQWRLGAVSTATWTGVPLRFLLEPAGVASTVVEILFRGADHGKPPGLGREIAYERSLPLARALADDVLVAYAMNDGPIPVEHGAPLRLVVPSWYGMASVKWLTEIVAVDAPFRGFYQAERYIIDGAPLGRMYPRAVIVAPFDIVEAGSPATIRGYAWSGSPVIRVELSSDAGATWRDAELAPAAGPAAWREWRAIWTAPVGTHVLFARATDAAGRTQPLLQRRTDLGYANNAAQSVRVVAR